MILHSEPGRVIASAPAKLNLFLEVTGRRDDGFHDLETVMQTISLSDTLVLESADDLSLHCPRLAELPAERNLAHRAATLLQDHLGLKRGARITLHKRIPAGAGLGGGSSDAASVLTGLCRLWEVSLPLDELTELAGRLGSDVPFFVHGNTALCRGRGELVEPIAARGVWHYLLVLPASSNNTAEVYRHFDRLGSYDIITADSVIRALASGEAMALGRALFNRLEAAGASINPDVRRSLDVLGDEGVLMTGSGSACFKLCESAAACAAEAYRVSPLLGGATVLSVTNEAGLFERTPCGAGP